MIPQLNEVVIYGRSRDKLNTYLDLQKTHGHQPRQVAGLQLEALILKTI